MRMLKLLLLSALCLLQFRSSLAVASEKIKTVLLEEKMELFEKAVKSNIKLELIQDSLYWKGDFGMNSMALVDVLWRKAWDSEKVEDHESVKLSLEKLNVEKLELADQIRVYLISKKLGVNLLHNSKFMSDTYDKSSNGKLERRELFTLLNYKEELKADGFETILKSVEETQKNDIETYYKANGLKAERTLTPSQLRDIVSYQPDFEDYKDGKYAGKPRLYMFCRHNRNYPCMMIMRDGDGHIVKNDNGSMWTQKSLGLARKGKPYNVKNGYTPAGVYTIDSVMPEANNQLLYGKYRRLILNFIPRSWRERKTKVFLPRSSYKTAWWNQAVVARDIGRNLLRIHGTGMRNLNSSSSHYPFVMTSGCIAQRENQYDGKTYHDQRFLLDQLMKASFLEPNYKNEAQIYGILYVVEMDGKEAPVERKDIEAFLN